MQTDKIGEAVVPDVSKEAFPTPLLTLFSLGCRNDIKTLGGGQICPTIDILEILLKPYFSKFAMVCIKSK